jgi:Amino acid permease
MAEVIQQPGTGADQHTVAQTELKAGAIGLPGVLMQGVTAIAPAIAGLFTIPFIVLNAGVAAPLAYLGAFIIALMLGYVLAQFAKHMTSTGTYYTFISNSLGERWGFLVAWTYLLFFPVVVAQVGSFMGSTLQSTLLSEYSITFHWWYFMVFLIALVALTGWRGIELSVGLLVVLGIIEIVIVLALAISGFIDPGSGGINLHWLNPGNAPSGHGLFLGVVFAIFAISGWDAAAPLGEESEDPKRNVPRGVMGSIILLGVFLVFVSWGQTAGWGTNHMTAFASSSELPAFVLGHRFWGGAWVIVLIALFNSTVAVAIVARRGDDGRLQRQQGGCSRHRSLRGDRPRALRDPRQRCRPGRRRHRDRGAGGSQPGTGAGVSEDDPPRAVRAAAGHRRRGPVPGLRSGVVHHRTDARDRRRPDPRDHRGSANGSDRNGGCLSELG